MQLVAQMVKRLPAMRETRVRSLGWEDLLEKETATHSSILAWEIPWTEEPGGLQCVGLQKSRTRLSNFTYTHTRASLVPQTVKNLPAMQETWVQSLGWEDPLEQGMTTHSSILAWRILVDRGAWWATVHGVAKSWIQLSDFTFLIDIS